MRFSLSWFRIGAVLAGLAVAFGAFAAHGLDQYLPEKYRDAPPKKVAGLEVPASWKYLHDFKTGAEYQMYHSLGLLAVGLAAAHSARRRALDLAGWCFLLGIVLFSGSLYLLTLTGATRWAIATPFGGLFFLVGWAALACALVDQRRNALH
ncbi:MAG TPA: DUF423 domain-containing protein [Planctomycetaceae bacterium]|jgi:uncharacterized membrane protein YgdD (TMEM256/DUF423 family)|nr:DUF423 domain-containing protein [Planctomycetaceae bacterium]